MDDNLLIVVPARGGSTRIPKKNLCKLGEKHLIEYTLDIIVAANREQDSVVSTDCQDIRRFVEERYDGSIQVINRPSSLSHSTASTESALIHPLDVLGRKDGWVMTLQPTSPFRNIGTFTMFMELIVSAPSHIDCFMSCTKSFGDFWTKDDCSQIAKRIFEDAPRRQQDRSPLYEENSAYYVSRISSLFSNKSLLGAYTELVQTSFLEGWDINTWDDMEIAASLLGLYRHKCSMS